MKALRTLISISVFVLISIAGFDANAQCSMCTLSAENSVQNGNTQGKGLNKGILLLLAAPYIAGAGIGYVWYTRYRRKNIPVDIKDEKINLN
jgi:hypothetical protein